jgi:ribonuclease D
MPRAPRHRFPPPSLITTTEELEAACRRLRPSDRTGDGTGDSAGHFVTVDTEFIRERTYWPELCVVQLGGTDEVVVIDAQAPGLDLTALGELLADQAVTKVFHAARQDIEIFNLKFGAIPRPLFDTQVAAMVAGFGDQVGYEALVGGLTDGSIDKAHQYSDWSVRPLSPDQIAYAAADVTYLREIYRKLRARLDADGRLAWVAEEMAVLTDPATYRTDPEAMWRRLRTRSTSRRYLGMLRALAAWREQEAQRVNIPRPRLLRDEILMELAATVPATVEALGRTRGLSRGFVDGPMGEALLAAIAAAKQLPPDAMPEAPQERPGPRPSPALVALLKVLLAAKCEQHHVAARLVAGSDDIERLAVEAAPDVPALQGWRRTVFGEDALALRQGRIALGVDGRQVRLVDVPG